MKETKIFAKTIIGVFSILSTVLLWNTAFCQSHFFDYTTQKQIEIAKQIWDIEKLAESSDSDVITRLENYLSSPDLPIARLAARQLGFMGSDTAEDVLLSRKSDSLNLSIKVSLAYQMAKDKQSAVKNMLQVLDDPHITPARNHRLKNEIAAVFAKKGWVEELELYFKDNPQTTYALMRSDIDNLSFAEKKRFLENALLNFKTPLEYEAAMRLLVEEIKHEEIPFILEMLEKPANIPEKMPPPFTRTHTIYHILMSVLKSIPDQRAIPIFTDLSLSSNEYVSSEAQEALLWVQSDVPFPIKYLRLLLESDEG
jgi:HEAT repeat protein